MGKTSSKFMVQAMGTKMAVAFANIFMGPNIKSTAEESDIETTFLDTNVYKGERFESPFSQFSSSLS